MSTSKSIKHATGGVTLVALFTLVLLVRSAEANLMWHWTGDCVSQQPTVPLCQHATIDIVTTDNYVPGTLVEGPPSPTFPDRPTILRFLYTDDAGVNSDDRGDHDFNWNNDGTGFLFPAVGGHADGFLTTVSTVFRSATDGTWRVAGEGMIPPAECDFRNIFCSSDARGINGMWTIQTPEPSTWLLVPTAVGLAWLARKKRKAILSK